MKKGLSGTNLIIIAIVIIILSGIIYFAFQYYMTVLHYSSDISNFITS